MEMGSRRIENIIRGWIFMEELKNHNEQMVSRFQEDAFTDFQEPETYPNRLGEYVIVR